MKLLQMLAILALSASILSCKTQQKIPYYLESRKDTSGKVTVNIPPLRIQKNDQLSIQIFSLSTEPKADALYNMPETITEGTAGYWVDLKGNILHHRLGTIQAEGLTKEELADEIKKRLTEPVELLRSPTVIVRLLNFKVNILGQVGKEGPITIPGGERMTILEAIAMAGGVTDYGKRDSIKIFREQNGIREMGTVDLSSDSVFHSPYYNLMQNDFIIVGQTKQRLKEQDQQKTFQKVTMGLALVGAAATFISLFSIGR
jgi:polysaccharide export outer membrane protein